MYFTIIGCVLLFSAPGNGAEIEAAECANLSCVLHGGVPADFVLLNKHSQLARRKYSEISVRFIFLHDFSEFASSADGKDGSLHTRLAVYTHATRTPWHGSRLLYAFNLWPLSCCALSKIARQKIHNQLRKWMTKC